MQPSQVNAGRAQIKRGQFLHQRQRLSNRKFDLIDLTSEAVCLQNVDGRLVYQLATVDSGDNVVLTVQTADQRDHCFGLGLAVDPFVEAFAHGFRHGGSSSW